MSVIIDGSSMCTIFQVTAAMLIQSTDVIDTTVALEINQPVCVFTFPDHLLSDSSIEFIAKFS
jgi:hypothetical protein